MTKRQARKYAEAIVNNVAMLQSGRITFDQFGKLNEATWNAVARGEPNIIGSDCAKRHEMVQRELDVLRQFPS
jgi:hypothetical protein